MDGHLLKVALNKTLSDKEKERQINQLWLQNESLLNEARAELVKALPYLRKRLEGGQPDVAYLAIIKARGLLAELEGN